MAMACAIGRRSGVERQQSRKHRVGDEHARTTPPIDRKQHGFDDQLPDEAAAIRAKRVPNGELPAPCLSIRHEQRREIDADDQQDGEDGAAEQEQRVALVADKVLVQWHD